MELLYLASMAPAGAEKKIRNNIELYAPCVEVEALIQHLSVTPHYQKVRTAEELGRLLHLTNAERERLKLWRIRPIVTPGGQGPSARMAVNRSLHTHNGH
jgi:hypothetical protein